MTAPAKKYRYATADEIGKLEVIARQEHVHLGVDEPHGQLIEVRVRNLAQERGLRIPGTPVSHDSPHRPRPSGGPNYLQAGLEQKAQQCAVDRRAAKLKTHIKIVRRNKDHFYLFCFLEGGFSKALRKTRALEVFTKIIEQANRDIETWVSIAKMAERLGRTPKTVSKALRALEEKGIITRINAADRCVGLHGKPIRKNQGYVIRLHAPMFWGWESIGGAPEEMKKYLADYEDEIVDNSETPVTVTGVPR